MQTVNVGKLTFVPVTQASDLVGEPVKRYLQANEPNGLWVSEIDPNLADTTAFCEHYGVGLDISANCVASKPGAASGSGTRRVSCWLPCAPTSTG